MPMIPFEGLRQLFGGIRNSDLDANFDDLDTRVTALESGGGGGGGSKAFAEFYLSTGGATGLNNVSQTLVLNNTRHANAAFTLASSEITFNTAGTYWLAFDTYLNNSSTSRSEFSVYLAVDVGGTGTFAEPAGVRSAIYLRGYDSGQSATINTVRTVAVGDVIRYRTLRTDGGATAYQDDNGTRLVILEL